ncbi:MAG: hypothetical protein MUF21_02930 [Gemmatimonadaceae bacterium]|nr:hypothetical protein [Gemmatimonadaceae bacterium]
MTPLFRSVIAATLLGLAIAACSDDGSTTEPPAPGPEVPQAQLTFLRLAADAPPASNTSVSFWAVRGQDREGSIYLRPRAGRTDSLELLNFKVGSNSLLTYPDGRAFQRGDSVRITIRIVDLSRLIFEFQPSGLRFSTRDPAELEIEYGECDDDVNRDGRVDTNDDLARRQFAIWRQEALGAPWQRLSSLLDIDDEEVEADIFGFTNHAIAY